MSLRILRTIKRFIPHLISFVGFRRTPPTRRTRKRRCQTKTNSYRYNALIANGDQVYWGPASAFIIAYFTADGITIRPTRYTLESPRNVGWSLGTRRLAV